MSISGVITCLLLSVALATAETRVSIVGMKSRSQSQMMELVGERLVHVKASPASAPLADDAAFLLEQALKKDGFADAVVDWKLSGRDEIILTVREGRHLALGEVRVSGVPPDKAGKLAKIYARPVDKGRPFGSGPSPFREKDVETGLSFIRQELNADGYWAAEATISSRSTDAATGKVNISIEAIPGPRHQIVLPVVNAGDSNVREIALSVMRPFVGRPANTGNLNAMRLAVEESVAARGYPDAKIQMSRMLEVGRFITAFTIDTGKRVRLGHLHIEGLERTRSQRIASRLKHLEGEWYDEATMNRRLREFLTTGAFTAASIETADAGGESVDATLHFEEARAKELGFAAGFGSYQGAIFRMTYADRNLMGNLMGFSTGFEFSSRGVLGETRLTDPWLFGSDVSATGRGFALVYGRDGYDSYETGLDGKVTWKFGSHYTLDLLAGYSVVNLTENGLPSAELGETVYTHPKLRLIQTLDYRDSAVLPKGGWHFESPLEIGAAVGGVSTSYAMAGLSGGWYHEINGQYAVGIGGECEFLIPGGDSTDLPIDLRLFNGGARSVRSFPERGLGPLVKGYATGGEGIWNGNLELIRNVTGSLKAVAFFDAGALSRNYEDLASSNVELASGLGIRLDLPIGPVRLEYGYNLTRDKGEPLGALHFAIGGAF